VSHLHNSSGQVPQNRKFRSLIDLGTASVKALVVELRGNETHIWGHGQAPLEGGYGPAGEITDHEAIAAACDVALSMAEEITRNTFGRKIVPDQSVWGVPGWMYRGQPISFQQRRPRPEKRISRREWQSIQARLDRVVGRLSGTPLDIISTAKIDGHTVTEAIGLQGETLAIQAFVVSVDSAAQAILHKVAAELELDPPVLVSHARAVAMALSHDGIMLDMGRWGTSIVLVRQGRLTGSGWIPLGGQSFYRTLANGFGLSPAKLPIFCQDYINGLLPPVITNAANAALVDPANRWLDMIQELLATLAAGVSHSLPHKIYLAGGAGQLPALSLIARQYHWTQQLPWSRHPEVSLWQANSINGLTNHTGHTWKATDLICLGLARLA